MYRTLKSWTFQLYPVLYTLIYSLTNRPTKDVQCQEWCSVQQNTESLLPPLHDTCNFSFTPLSSNYPCHKYSNSIAFDGSLDWPLRS